MVYNQSLQVVPILSFRAEFYFSGFMQYHPALVIMVPEVPSIQDTMFAFMTLTFKRTAEFFQGWYSIWFAQFFLTIAFRFNSFVRNNAGDDITSFLNSSYEAHGFSLFHYWQY